MFCAMPDAEPSRDATPDVERRRGYALLPVIGWALIVLWAAWWIAAFAQGRLWGVENTRIPAWKFLGLDFQHNYDAARFWIAGHNPYAEDFGDWRGTFAYPPIVLPLFAWCALLPRFAGRFGLCCVPGPGSADGALARPCCSRRILSSRTDVL